MIVSIKTKLKVEVTNILIIDNPNSKKQRIFDELGMIELITLMLEKINCSMP
jgi:hypothetical protein